MLLVTDCVVFVLTFPKFYIMFFSDLHNNCLVTSMFVGGAIRRKAHLEAVQVYIYVTMMLLIASSIHLPIGLAT